MEYFLQKQGVYSHGVYGFFDELDDAIKAADDSAKADTDGYHSWIVIETPVFDVNNTQKDNKSVTHPVYMAQQGYKGVYT